MTNCGNEIPSTSNLNLLSSSSKPYVRIVEQPAPRSLRFRYKCEDPRSAGSIRGINSTSGTRTYPTIQVVGHEGRAKIFVSCVTNDTPHRPHPHRLVGEGCKYGVCRLDIQVNTTVNLQFTNLGIQCTRRQDIRDELKIREEIGIDPFKTGFNHKHRPKSIDLSCLRLCFQVFLEDANTGRFKTLHPVISDTVHNKKTSSDLVIVELSDCVSYVDDVGKKIILLCQKVLKEDIQVHFFEEKDGVVVWEGLGEFQPSNVHQQTAISFKPPIYHDLDIQDPVKVFVQLRRPSDGSTSEPLPFQFLPSIEKRKRKRLAQIPNLSQELDLLPHLNPYIPDELMQIPSTEQFNNQVSLQLATNSFPDVWNIPHVHNSGHNGPFNNNLNIQQGDSSSLLNLIDLDHQELEQIHISSGELSTGDLVDVANLSRTLGSNLSLINVLGDQVSKDGYNNFTDNTMESLL